MKPTPRTDLFVDSRELTVGHSFFRRHDFRHLDVTIELLPDGDRGPENRSH